VVSFKDPGSTHSSKRPGRRSTTPAATSCTGRWTPALRRGPSSSCTAGRRSTPCASGCAGLRPSVAGTTCKTCGSAGGEAVLARRVLAMTATILESPWSVRGCPGGARRPGGRAGGSRLARGQREHPAAARVPGLMGLDEPIWPVTCAGSGTSSGATSEPRSATAAPSSRCSARRSRSRCSSHPVFADRVPPRGPGRDRLRGAAGRVPDRSLATLAFISTRCPCNGSRVLWSGQAASHPRPPLGGERPRPARPAGPPRAALVCLSYGSVAVISRFLRSSMLEEMRQITCAPRVPRGSPRRP